MKEKPKIWIIKISHRPHGNADKRTVVSYDEKGKRTVREEKIEPTPHKEGYYNGDKAWQMVQRNEAEKLTHKDANRILGHLKRLGYCAIMENTEALQLVAK